MARKVEQFPEELRRTTYRQYPWDEWFDGDPWELVAGEDFTVKTKSMRTMAQQFARMRGGRCKTAETPDGTRLYVQYVGPQPGAATPPGAAEPPAEPPAESSREPRPRDAADRDRSRSVRAWARANGWPDLADAGRLPSEVWDAYDRATADHANVRHFTPRDWSPSQTVDT